MSAKRLKPPNAIFHIYARLVHKRPLLDDLDREVWVASLHRAAAFSGVEVITYCVLRNHFHILVRIDRKAKDVDDPALVSRFAELYGDHRAEWCGLDARGLARALEEGPEREAERLRNRLRARMGDVSEFMRTLRMRYTKWFNQRHGTVGTLWAEAFGSTLIEMNPKVVALVAAYVDLNPVRAGFARLPEDYRWCGYTEALAGNPNLREQLARWCAGGEVSDVKALARYRMQLLGRALGPKRDGSGATICPTDFVAGAKTGGHLSAGEQRQMRTRFMQKGLILGTQAYFETPEVRDLLVRFGRVPKARTIGEWAGGHLQMAARWICRLKGKDNSGAAGAN